MIVAWGIKDEAQYCTKDNLYSKMTNIGYPTNHEVTYRGSFAAIGKKGMTGG